MGLFNQLGVSERDTGLAPTAPAKLCRMTRGSRRARLLPARPLRPIRRISRSQKISSPQLPGLMDTYLEFHGVPVAKEDFLDFWLG